MRDAEVHAAAARENLVAHRPDFAPRVVMPAREVLREADADLHRAAGVHGVGLRQQATAHRDAVDEGFVDFAQLALGAHLRQALRVGFAVGRIEFERDAHRELRHPVRAGAPDDFPRGDTRKTRHHGVGDVARLLFGDRERGAQVVVARLHLQGGEGDADVFRPAGAVGKPRR